MTADGDERLSIIIPVLNEAVRIPDVLTAIQPYRARGVEVIVADGGSGDQTVKLALPLCDQVVTAPRGRGAQMNAGAAAARGDILLFLHADTALPAEADRLVRDGLASGDRAWGRFDVAIMGRHWLLPIVAFMMSLRSRLTGIATGDQAVFVLRDAFAAVGGFPDIPLMEDIVLSQRLKRLTPPLCLRERVITSGRRWEKNGVMRTIVLMWRLRLAFYLGAKPDDLARAYGYVPRDA
jgi:rSAM/selenodomain-associated transferase 2